MHASTQAIDVNDTSDPGAPRVRERPARRVCAAAAPRIESAEPMTFVHDAESRRYAKRFHARLGSRVEHALFAFTIAATAYLYLGVFLQQAM